VFHWSPQRRLQFGAAAVHEVNAKPGAGRDARADGRACLRFQPSRQGVALRQKGCVIAARRGAIRIANEAAPKRASSSCIEGHFDAPLQETTRRSKPLLATLATKTSRKSANSSKI
jgi:hypothetical protein